MKNLFLSAIFATVAFVSNAQLFNFQTFRYQEITIPDISRDSIFSNEMIFESTYIFDLNKNSITSSINGIVSTCKVTVIIQDTYIFLTYVDFPTTSWTINLNKNTAVYNEINSDNEKEFRFTSSILTKL
jgi:hypothetical protein